MRSRVTSIFKEMIINCRQSWLLNKFSFLAPWEMYREQYGEYAYWCKELSTEFASLGTFHVLLITSYLFYRWMYHIFSGVWARPEPWYSSLDNNYILVDKTLYNFYPVKKLTKSKTLTRWIENMILKLSVVVLNLGSTLVDWMYLFSLSKYISPCETFWAVFALLCDRNINALWEGTKTQPFNFVWNNLVSNTA